MLKRLTEQKVYSKETTDQIHYEVKKLNERMEMLSKMIKEGRYDGAYGAVHSLQHRAGVLKQTFRLQ